jgi:hypothetical protein
MGRPATIAVSGDNSKARTVSRLEVGENVLVHQRTRVPPRTAPRYNER